MNKKTLLVVASSAALLCACSKLGASASAGSSAENQSTTTNSVDRSKSVTSTSDKKVTSKVSAYTIISEALGENHGPENASELFKFAPNVAPEKPTKWEREQVAEAGKQNSQLSPFMTNALARKVPPLDAVHRGEYEAMLIGCTGPQNGWPVNPDKQDDNTFMYLKATAVMCSFASSVYLDLAKRVSPLDLANADAAKKAVVDAWYSIPISDLKQKWHEAFSEIPHQFHIMSSKDSFGYSTEKSTYENKGSGFVWTKSGAKWFGDGMIEGRSYEFTVADGMAAKLDESKKDSNSTSTKATDKTGASINSN